VDWAGAVLLAVALTCLVTAIIQSSSAAAPALVAVASATLLAFLAVERRTPHPLLPVPRGAARPLALACGVAGLMNLCTLSALFLLTQDL
jgi:DHA2 family methylenomycin A resistance protein-like MFS transporter